MAVKKDPRTLELAEPFVSLFPVEPETLALVTDSIRERGYQVDKPILVWKDAFGDRGRQVVIDGHTRLRAALDLKLPEVFATVRQFKDVDAAITAGIGEQVIRRNLNREQIAAYVVSILPLLDERKGGLRKRTAKQLAALVGVSVPTIDRARGVIGSGDADLIAKVKSGELSLLAAYDQVTGRVAPPKAYMPPPETSAIAEEMQPPSIGSAFSPIGESDEEYHDEEDVSGNDGGGTHAWTAPHKRVVVGERKRKGTWERARDVENALYLLWWELAEEIEEARQSGSLAETIDYLDFKLGRARSVYESVEKELVDARGGARHLKRLEALRNVEGRTPEEAAAFLAKADELEGKSA